ncbi:MAG: PrsW family intramembrane metalloprotease [Acidobacteria bacterium]|nr:PrsW family intramembrane metalloprotease [Acidobacteriota bacterium]
MLRLLPRRLQHDRRLRRLVLPALAIAASSIVIALVLHSLSGATVTASDRAIKLAAMGDLESADRMFVEALSAKTDFETLIAFIDNRAAIVEIASIAESLAPEEMPRAAGGNEVVERFLASRDLHGDERRMARYWFELRLVDPSADRAPLAALADRSPTVRHANELLARAALLDSNLGEAARRYEREGFAFPGQAEDDLRRALEIWKRLDAWDEIRARVSDPRYRGVSGPRLRVALAEHDRNWGPILLWIWPASFEGVTAWPVGLAILSGALWFLIVGGLGRIAEPERGRRALYAFAFVLGVLSVYPTLLVITLEESLLGLRETGEVIPDAIYYIFGVGLREEACKLLLFLPLMPLLRRRGQRLEALTCGALVGLGFAAEENVLYFQNFDASVALTRFLTANLLHVSLTAIAGLAVYDAARAWNRSAEILNSTLPMVVLLHGGYDFLLSSPQFGDLSFLAMTLFVLIAQRFLRELTGLSTSQQQERVLRLFIVAITLIAGASYVYATTLVGPLLGFAYVATGLLGVLIFAYMFVRELA